MKRLLIISALFITIAVYSQGNINKPFDAFMKNEAMKNAAISICVTDTKTDSILLSSTQQLCLVPASVQKLITSASALEILGGKQQFKTIVWSRGTIKNGKLTGDLVITGGGDPTLGSENFCVPGEKKKFLSEWAHQIKQRGIDTITGNLVADPYLFSDQDVPGSWLWEDVANYFGAVATGISVYDDIYELHFNVPAIEGQPTEITHIEPEIPGLLLKNKVLSSSQKGDHAYVFGSPYDTYRLIKGTLPVGSPDFIVKASVPDASLLLANELKKVLTDSLVVVLGDIEKKKVISPSRIDSQQINVLWLSPDLSEIIEKMNKESINLYAETLLKHIGFTISENGSTEAGVAAIKDFWNKHGVDTQDLFMVDGSGLSRQNAFTAKTLVDILVYMKNKSPWFDAFKKSIPLTGIEGTQKNYFQESVLKGKANAKTGSMTRVRSMAGYMTTQHGKEIAFAMIINNYSTTSSTVNQIIEKWIESLYLNL
ncbi:MAG TPA: D-alanyl-D-alanine carboxypeptidase/D-alanyl-D-alanine-endopeptidase [Prolixibacteraceae bacterium]|nr:D-alanyl-D-alanine carboxypeptidase/D-alanyl-D-alanine-endopeptidase [Prolixibacteraceae bacterium]